MNYCINCKYHEDGYCVRGNNFINRSLVTGKIKGGWTCESARRCKCGEKGKFFEALNQHTDELLPTMEDHYVN